MNRGTLTFIGICLAVLLIATALYYRSLGPTAPVAVPSPSEPAPADIPVAVVEAPATGLLVHADGTVEMRVGRAAWSPVSTGDSIAQHVDLRTRGESNATVTYGDAIRFEVTADTQVRLGEISDDLAKFVISAPKGAFGAGATVIADVSEANTRRVLVTTEGNEAVAETRNGRMHVMRDSDGALQTAVTRGEATLSNAGKTVIVAEGFQSRARVGKVPHEPTGIPRSLLLKIKWPSASTPKKKHRISGTAAPFARIQIGEKKITADAKGRFSAVISLSEGQNTLHVGALDVLGRSKRQDSSPIVLDTRAPEHRVKTGPEIWQDGP